MNNDDWEDKVIALYLAAWDNFCSTSDKATRDKWYTRYITLKELAETFKIA
jgi:hypothetical protein